MEDLITKILCVSEPQNCLLDDASIGPFQIKQKEDYTQYFEEKEVDDDVKFDVKNNTAVLTNELYLNYVDELFKTRVFITNETWDKTINVNAKILYKDINTVICECLIDKTNLVFEKMSFPSHIFNHIDNYSEYPFVILSIKSKVGSTRIDVTRGEGLVDKKVFEISEEWQKLNGQDFNQPLEKPLKL